MSPLLLAPPQAPACARAGVAAPRSRLAPCRAAADDMCRDKVAERREMKGESATRCTVQFCGADGEALSLEVPTARRAPLPRRG